MIGTYMPSGPQNFTLKEMKRAARALQEMGIRIKGVAVERGRVEFITAEDPLAPAKVKATAEVATDATRS
jgi:anion-transporting  ArsA/GET3 family ATPase